MTPRTRKIALSAVFLLCLALVIADRSGNAQQGEVVGAVARPSVQIVAVHTSYQAASPTNFSDQSKDGVLHLRSREEYSVAADNVFSIAQQSGINRPAAQPILPVAPPPEPTAPRLPFVVIGKQRHGQQWEVFLAKSDQTLVAREGDTLDNQYQVVAIKPPTMQLLYLPLKQTQTLMIGTSFDD